MTGEDFPADPQEQLAGRSGRCSTRGRASARCSTGASTASPTTGAPRSTCSRWCSATRGTTSGSGVAFSRDEVTGEPEPSGDFLVNAQGEDVVSGVRNTRDIAELAERHARGPRRADGDPAHARGPLPRHAGHRVHGRGGAPLHAADAQRQAPGAGRGALRGRRGRRGAARRRARRWRRSTPRASTRCCTRPSTPTLEYEVLARGVAASPGAAKGEIVFTADDAVEAGRRRAATSCSCGRSPRPTTWPASTPRAASSRARAARRRTPRSSRAAWARPAVTARATWRSTCRRATVERGDGTSSARATRIAIDGTTGAITTEDVPLVSPR